MIETNKSLSSLQNRYLLALLIIITFLFGIFYSVHLIIQTKHDDAALINIAGKQRMLSQRTALYTLKLFQDDQAVIDAIKDTLMEDLHELEMSHNDLIFGSQERGLPSKQSRAVEEIYFSYPDRLNLRMTHYLSGVKSIINKLLQGEEVDRLAVKAAIKDSTDDLLFVLDKVVKQYERESNARVSRLEILAFMLLGLALATILIAGYLVFNPIIKVIKLGHDTLQHHQGEHEKFMQLAKQHPSPIVLMNCEGDVLFANIAASKAFLDIENEGMGHDIFTGLESFICNVERTQIDRLTKVRDQRYNEHDYKQTIHAIRLGDHMGVIAYM